MSLPVRMANLIGTRASLRIYWGDNECPNCVGHGSPGYHNAMHFLGDSSEPHDYKYLGEPEDYKDDPRWPKKCDHCQAVAPEDVQRQVFREPLYDTPSGRLEPGCLYWVDWHGCADGHCVAGWTNCDGKHLHAVCPNGRHWDIDSRASNCTMRDDTTHRCWVRTGEPPNITVGKSGRTCAAGAGSIQAGDYHGFLHGGVFT